MEDLTLISIVGVVDKPSVFIQISRATLPHLGLMGAQGPSPLQRLLRSASQRPF